MSQKETWFCVRCGSLDIRHDATVQWDPEAHDWVVLDVQDHTWCEDCACSGGLDREDGEPKHGVFGGTWVYEVLLPGFDGSTDETDDKLLWVRASSLDAVTARYPEAEVEPLDEAYDVAPGDIDEDLALET